MKCPRCDGDLKKTMYAGMEVEACSSCGGVWLARNELDELEDKVYSNDDEKGTVFLKSESVDMKCPVCSEKLQEFEYRYSDLILDYCKNGHGWWLDKSEDQKIVDLMSQVEGEVERKHKIENEWSDHVKKLRSPSFIDKVKDVFNKD